jgi:hypothetical protein
MSSWTAQIRRAQAEERRQERAAEKRQKDLERLLKERAKLSALEQARLEVEAHENALEILLSVHKEHSAPVEWIRFASALPPHKPWNSRRYEFAAVLKQNIATLENASSTGSTVAEGARLLDEREQQAALAQYTKDFAEWERMRGLAKRVLLGEPKAYTEAITEFSSLATISVLGSSFQGIVHSSKLMGCVLTVNGREAIPAETKSLTSAGKLSVKAMPKQRFHEIYQDYVCGCVLRLAREILALLPLDEVLITASVNGTDSRTGQAAALPVLSVAISRASVERLDFERLDPSDSMENFPHRGDVMASRKSGEFAPIVPLTPADLAPTQPERMDFSGLLVNVRQLRTEIASKLQVVSAATDNNGAESLPPA